MKVAIAEDTVLLREGLASLLTGAGHQVVGQSETAADLLLHVRSYDPDIALVDIRLPPTHSDEGLRAAMLIRAKHPRTKVMVLSSHSESRYAVELLADDASGVGYLLKERVSNFKEFLASMERVAAGGTALDPEVVSRLLGRKRGGGPLDELTPREREVMQLMAEGRSNSGIAEALVVTDRAVEKHVTNIFGKLGLHAASEDHRRVLAVLTYLRAQ